VPPVACEDALVIEVDGRPPTQAELAALAVTGYSCFTTMLVVDGRVRGLPLHLHRLAEDSRELFGVAPDEERVCRLAARAGAGPVVVRVAVVDPALDLAHPGTGEPALLVTTRPAPEASLPPLRLRTVRHVRQLAPVKHAGLLPALHLRARAQRAGYDDALFVSPGGDLLEGPTWGLAVLLEGQLVLPAGPVLPGVTAALLREVAGTAGLSAVVSPVPLAALADRPAVVTTSAVTGVRPVASVDDRPLRTDAPEVAALRAAYLALPGEPLG
jgi:branched-subunit amino acid aminotransferase/4-amino-4-deoxychorismate lyase